MYKYNTGFLSSHRMFVMSSLFAPLTLGDLRLRNRIALPLTRCRSEQPGNVPGTMMVDYYRQRASAGFMVTEGTQIEPRGQGYAWTPGIHSEAQIAGWRKVTDAVHAEGGTLFASSGTLDAYRTMNCSQESSLRWPLQPLPPAV
jgi:N-ethylmaleimide reductase